MKKSILSLIGILMAVAFAPQASALPLFARQTGMECAACHFQHFPMLTAFGRAFKSGAYTMIGAQGKVEGDHLSIPNTLNMAVLTTFGYEKTNQLPGDSSNGSVNPGNGTYYVPSNGGELSLFYGGRISDNAGFLSELGETGGAATGSAKLPLLFEVADGTRAGIVPFATDAQGASYGFETLNTGANAVHQMSPVGGENGAHTNAISAQQYIGTATGASGFAFVVNNPGYFINLTKYNQTMPGSQDAGQVANYGSTYARVAYIFDLAGWDSGVGVQSWSGSSYVDSSSPGAGAGTVISTKATAIDAQMQGELGGKPVGFYVTYAKAPADTVNGNAYNFTSINAVPGTGTLTRSSFNVAAEVGLVPNVATLGVAVRFANSGVDDGLNNGASATGANTKDNAFMLTATYKLAQNMMTSLSYTTNSGSYWNQANIDAIGSKTTTINVFTLF